MSALKVMTVFGTRPEAIKMAPVVRELATRDGVESLVCVTAQHREMLDQVLDVFSITPDFDLDLMRDNQSLCDLTAALFSGLGKLFAAEKPDWVLVQGDTATCMVASMAAFYNRIRVGHVEAGLRTGDLLQPFPEESNRRITGMVADLHFPPTNLALQNLLNEGVDPANAPVTGNTVIDALQIAAAMDYDISTGPLAGIPQDKRIILVTAHRRENFGQPIRDIAGALKRITEEIPNTHVVYPVHRNPNILGPVTKLLSGEPNITLLEPLDYLPLIQLLKRAEIVLTDSGGIQEEAPGLGKPVLCLRNKTERPEGVDHGVVKLVGTDPDVVFNEAHKLLTDPNAYTTMAEAVNPYGDGKAARRIVDRLLQG